MHTKIYSRIHSCNLRHFCINTFHSKISPGNKDLHKNVNKVTKHHSLLKVVKFKTIIFITIYYTIMAQIKIRNCCVPSCKETHITCESFFRFPNDPRDRKRWKSAIGFPQDFEVIFIFLFELKHRKLYLNIIFNCIF